MTVAGRGVKREDSRFRGNDGRKSWMPAFAGMTSLERRRVSAAGFGGLRLGSGLLRLRLRRARNDGGRAGG
jgi:hypothetical protein